MTERNQEALHVPFSWQFEQWQRLIRQCHDNRLPHALMFVGPAGIGKFNLAAVLGEFLLCRVPTEDKSCGRCKCCELNRIQGHPDFLQLRPQAGSRAIKIDQVRALTDFVNKTAQQSGRKIVLLEPVEALNSNAANALLKCLEEPSGNTTLILVSHQPSLVMATIRSRCQIQMCSIPSTELALAWLEPLATRHDAKSLLQAAGGAPLTAFNMLKEDRLQSRETLLKGLQAIAGSRQSPLSIAGELSAGEPLDSVESIMQWLQAALRSRSLNEPSIMDGEDVASILARVPEMPLYLFWDKLVKLKRQLMSSANPNKQLLLEELLLDWQALTDLR